MCFIDNNLKFLIIFKKAYYRSLFDGYSSFKMGSYVYVTLNRDINTEMCVNNIKDFLTQQNILYKDVYIYPRKPITDTFSNGSKITTIRYTIYIN
jgi:hypothetical protein